jgi:peptidoglycan/LPS O-acetylase OafA/YrhL
VAPRPHLHALTGLRLIAALAVYFSHVAAPAGAPTWLLTLQQSGYVGVTFFFILSGFVLALNYFDRLRTREQIWRYAVARFARIYPLYLAVLAWPTVHLWVAGELSKREFLQHALGLQAWNPDLQVAFGFVGPAWSISVELFLYATLPLLVPVVRLLDRTILAVVGSLVVVVLALAALAWLFDGSGQGTLPWADPASAHRWLYRTPLLRLGDFLLGILAARLFLRLRERAAARGLGSWLMTLGVTSSILLAAQPSLVLTTWSWDAAYALPAAVLILGLALTPRHPLARLLALPPIVFLGEASFAFYLVHKFVIGLTGAGSWSTGVSPAVLALEAMNLGLAVALAAGLHLGIEKPARILVTRLLVRPAGGPGARPPQPIFQPPVHDTAASHGFDPATAPLRPAPAHPKVPEPRLPRTRSAVSPAADDQALVRG